MAYQLYYWPGLQGRGEFVRLALEAAGAPCVDVARGPEDAGQGMRALASERRIAFNETGIFRHCPALDPA